MTEHVSDVGLSLESGSRAPWIARIPFIGAFIQRVRLSRAEAPAQRFLWNPSPKKIQPGAVVCISLPASDPLGQLMAAIRVGTRPDHVVFVGDTTTMAHKAYDAVVQKGAVVHHTTKASNKQQRERVESELTPYYDAQRSRVEPRRQVKNPYTYTPAPAKVTPEEFRAFIKAVAEPERR